MKKFALMLLALLLCASAMAESAAQTGAFLTLPEGFAPIAEAEEQGYREAAAHDAGARYAGEMLLARRGEATIALTQATTEHASAQEAAEALLDEYAAYVAGFENVEAQTVEVGGRVFALVQVALDGETTSQYLLVEGGTLYTLTFTGVSEEETLAVLGSFSPAAASPQPTLLAVSTPAPSPAPAAVTQAP